MATVNRERACIVLGILTVELFHACTKEDSFHDFKHLYNRDKFYWQQLCVWCLSFELWRHVRQWFEAGENNNQQGIEAGVSQTLEWPVSWGLVTGRTQGQWTQLVRTENPVWVLARSTTEVIRPRPRRLVLWVCGGAWWLNWWTEDWPRSPALIQVVIF